MRKAEQLPLRTKEVWILTKTDKVDSVSCIYMTQKGAEKALLKYQNMDKRGVTNWRGEHIHRGYKVYSAIIKGIGYDNITIDVI